MKLVIINGSPRGKASNSEVIANWIATALDKSIEVDKYYTAKITTQREAVTAVDNNSTILVIFPLYVDAMPGVTKLFFEELELVANRKENVKMYFIVHSGFMGAKHSRAVEKYLTYLSEYLGFEYMGTAIKPSSEGIRLMPENTMLDIKNDFVELSKDISKGIEFNRNTLKSLAGFELPPEEFKTGIKESNGETGYFSYLLNQNNAFDKRYDKPYKRSK
ncbi:NADPH-dependent FMN reductase [Candidatus Izimaplasma bacterium HR1]|jgi:NAD(P)H-dependent FMN reductase|uniref:NAD(P)H-dependent oxidoreductase n=1 Tax=Candidatus Izimoplasma sp. HR1 TaxID=1541959 RepID=UPI0004F70BD4|nr:NADPH-dependent FMN reductase [Candidatus Izimaplasma bacterium HR1]